MDKVVTGDMLRIPIKLWLDDVEEGALNQARNLANLPFAFHHVALMPDCHQGYGMPIGGVMASEGAVVCNAVGVDIGCGVCTAATDLKGCDRESLKKVMSRIRESIPVGRNHHQRDQAWDGFDEAPDIPVVRAELNSARKQLGTLGGGNHFCEVQQDEQGYIWLMLHSGSRNFGYKIANHYHAVAKDLCTKWFSNIPTSDLAFLPLDSREGEEYLQAMNFAMSFAEESRRRMMSRVMNALQSVFPDVKFGPVKDVPHNYARMENHFNRNVMVHRKGATSAKEGEFGIIPGSQGTCSYLVTGKGNPESFTSCSHGAGRKMSRTKARNDLVLDDEVRRLDEAGIVHSIRSEKDLDEASGAYKNIDEVMTNQSDLVEVAYKLKPLGVIKG